MMSLTHLEQHMEEQTSEKVNNMGNPSRAFPLCLGPWSNRKWQNLFCSQVFDARAFAPGQLSVTLYWHPGKFDINF